LTKARASWGNRRGQKTSGPPRAATKKYIRICKKLAREEGYRRGGIGSQTPRERSKGIVPSATGCRKRGGGEEESIAGALMRRREGDVWITVISRKQFQGGDAGGVWEGERVGRLDVERQRRRALERRESRNGEIPFWPS